MKLHIQHDMDPTPHPQVLSPGPKQAREGDRRRGTRLLTSVTDSLNETLFIEHSGFVFQGPISFFSKYWNGT